jgi:hypothetical protein
MAIKYIRIFPAPALQRASVAFRENPPAYRPVMANQRAKVMQMASEDKLLHEIHRLKRRVGHLSSSTAPPDPGLLAEILEDIASALSEVHNEISTLKASSRSG